MASTDTTSDTSSVQKLTLLTMTGMVVGSMVGAGVFSLPRRFAQETGVTGALIAWLIAGTGMLMLAFVFQTLAIRKPDLDAGVYAYAKAGFGEIPRVLLRLRLLGQRLRRQRDLLGADHVHGRGHRSRAR
jgi:arginine:ornithine antiporter / lysine permease